MASDAESIRCMAAEDTAVNKGMGQAGNELKTTLLTVKL